VNPTQERIRYYTELLKILWITLIADIGGVASLALGPSWPWKEWVILLGVVVGIGLLCMVVLLHIAIERFLRTGGKGNA
jgi:hypothetical protein